MKLYTLNWWQNNYTLSKLEEQNKERQATDRQTVILHVCRASHRLHFGTPPLHIERAFKGGVSLQVDNLHSSFFSLLCCVVFAILSCNLVACHLANAFRQCSPATSHDIPLVSSSKSKSSTCWTFPCPNWRMLNLHFATFILAG